MDRGKIIMAQVAPQQTNTRIMPQKRGGLCSIAGACCLRLQTLNPFKGNNKISSIQANTLGATTPKTVTVKMLSGNSYTITNLEKITTGEELKRTIKQQIKAQRNQAYSIHQQRLACLESDQEVDATLLKFLQDKNSDNIEVIAKLSSKSHINYVPL